MSDLEKFQKVNECETLEQLSIVIESFADKDGFINGKDKNFNAKVMSSICKRYSSAEHNMLTRQFGIRQQALYILFYNDEIN